MTCEGAVTKFEVDQIRWVKSLLDPETGWLTQMPQLAERLVPVTARDGEVLVSEADIARVRADWKAACAHARSARGGAAHPAAGQPAVGLGHALPRP
jgi:hypothetical protein